MNVFKYVFFLLFTITVFSQVDLCAMNLTGSTIRGIYRSFENFVRPNGDRIVFQGETGVIELMPGQNSRRISTKALVGCTATVFYAKDRANIKRALLTHYARGSREQHLIELHHQLQQLHTVVSQHGFDDAHCIVVMPTLSGALKVFVHEGEDVFEAKSQVMYDSVEALVGQVFGRDNIKMKHVRYKLPPFTMHTVHEKTNVYVNLCNDAPSSCSIFGYEIIGHCQGYIAEFE